MFCLHLWFWLFEEHDHEMMGHETVHEDLTAYTIYDTTNGGWRFFWHLHLYTHAR